jgi:hypothetical protein
MLKVWQVAAANLKGYQGGAGQHNLGSYGGLLTGLPLGSDGQ